MLLSETYYYAIPPTTRDLMLVLRLNYQDNMATITFSGDYMSETRYSLPSWEVYSDDDDEPAETGLIFPSDDVFGVDKYELDFGVGYASFFPAHEGYRLRYAELRKSIPIEYARTLVERLPKAWLVLKETTQKKNGEVIVSTVRCGKD